MKISRCQLSGWKTMSEVIEYPAPDLSIVKPPESAWERERRAFRALLPELRAKYDGQFVAIKDGKVVASGTDRVAVALEAYSRVGYGPLYLGHVTDSPPPPVRIPSPRARPGSLLK
jgi:Family of unknown function (DUF5678)